MWNICSYWSAQARRITIIHQHLCPISSNASIPHHPLAVGWLSYGLLCRWWSVELMDTEQQYWLISYFLFVLVNHVLSLFIKFSFSIKQPPKINQFLRRWHDPRDHRESYWEEIGIDDVLIMEAGDTAHHHWMMCYTGPFEVSHHYLNALSYEDWERIRLACIITIGHSAIRAVRVVVREGSIGSIRYRQGIYHWYWSAWSISLRVKRMIYKTVFIRFMSQSISIISTKPNPHWKLYLLPFVKGVVNKV